MSFGVNFPLAPLMVRGNGMPCLACLLAVHVLAASLSKVFFILFYFIFFGVDTHAVNGRRQRLA
jgi:hypothetical protein